MSYTFSFPSFLTIAWQLNYKFFTNQITPSRLTQKKIIEDLANYFKDKKNQSLSDINLGISSTLLNLDLPKPGLLIIHLNLTQALISCAQGKKLHFDKTTIA